MKRPSDTTKALPNRRSSSVRDTPGTAAGRSVDTSTARRSVDTSTARRSVDTIAAPRPSTTESPKQAGGLQIAHYRYMFKYDRRKSGEKVWYCNKRTSLNCTARVITNDAQKMSDLIIHEAELSQHNHDKNGTGADLNSSRTTAAVAAPRRAKPSTPSEDEDRHYEASLSSRSQVSIPKSVSKKVQQRTPKANTTTKGTKAVATRRKHSTLSDDEDIDDQVSLSSRSQHSLPNPTPKSRRAVTPLPSKKLTNKDKLAEDTAKTPISTKGLETALEITDKTTQSIPSLVNVNIVTLVTTVSDDDLYTAKDTALYSSTGNDLRTAKDNLSVTDDDLRTAHE